MQGNSCTSLTRPAPGW